MDIVYLAALLALAGVTAAALLGCARLLQGGRA